MARRARAAKRDIQPDPVYRSRLVTQMVNRMMLDGKKSTAEGIMYDAMTLLRERTGNDPAGVLKEAVENVRPALEVKSRRVGGANYQVPIEVPTRRSYTLAVRWIITHSRAVVSTAWPNGSPTSCWTATTVPAPPSRRRKTSCGWPRRTKRSLTIAGSRHRIAI